jgi:hypothetical protein
VFIALCFLGALIWINFQKLGHAITFLSIGFLYDALIFRFYCRRGIQLGSIDREDEDYYFIRTMEDVEIRMPKVRNDRYRLNRNEQKNQIEYFFDTGIIHFEKERLPSKIT